jgi:hypothetical protein
VTYTPTDTANYNTASAAVQINVAKATPVISWSNPADITYGTALSGTQLNATSGDAAGNFVYTPASGTVLDAGNSQTLSVQFTPTDTANYNTPSAKTAPINVSKADQTISFTLGTSVTKTYGDAAFADTATATSGGTVTYSSDNTSVATVNSSGTVTITGAGTNHILANSAATANYNAALQASQTLTVDPLAVALTVVGIEASNKVYDGTTNATLNVTNAALVGVASGDDVSLDTTNAAGAFADKAVGTGKTVYVTGLALLGADVGKYTLTQPITNADITAASLTVTGVTAGDKVYDGTTATTLNTDSAALDGVISGDDVTLDAGSAASVFADATVGTGKTVTVSGIIISSVDAGNYELTQPAPTASITAATVTPSVTVTGKPYDGTTAATITDRSLNDVIGSDDVNLGASGTAAFEDKNVGMGKMVNITGLSLSGSTAVNYVLSATTASTTADITAVQLTVTAHNDGKTYDGLAYSGGNGVSYTGLVNGENPSVLGETLSFSGDSQGAINAGTCTITPAGLTSDNYNINFVDGTLTVTQAGLTVSADNQSRAYGATNPVFTVTYSGFVNNEDPNVLNGSPDVSTAADTNSPVGTYPIVVSQGNLSTNGNYSFNFVSGMLTIMPAGSLFFDDFTRGTDPGPLSPWIVRSGLWTVTGGVLNGGPNALQNYEFVYVTNNWTDYSVQGQVQFSTPNAWGGGIGGRLDPITGAHYAAWVYPEGSPGGSNILELVKYYDWTSWTVIQQVSLPGVGTNCHSLELAFQESQITVYYDTNQVLSVTDDGSFDGQGAYTNGGISVDMWTEYVTYTMSVDNVIVFPIVKTNQTITFDPLATRTYGEAPFAVSATASSGLPVTFSIVSGPATIAGDTITLTGAGAVTVRASQAGNSNFNPAPDVDQSFTVDPAAIAVTADAKSKVYGDTDPALTCQLTSGSLVSGDSFAGSLTREAGQNVGAYAILQDTLTAGANYNLTYTGADLTISAKAIAVTADDKSKTQGLANPALTASYDGFVNNENTNALTTQVTLSTAADANSVAGTTYPITAGGAAATNYTFSYVEGILTVVAQPDLAGISVSENQFTLTWPTIVGQNYQMEYKDSLDDPAWTPLGAPVAGTGNPLNVNDNNNNAPNRFYRLKITQP